MFAKGSTLDVWLVSECASAVCVITQQTFVGLQDMSQDVLKTKNCYAEDVLKTCFENVLKTSLEDVLKTYLEEVLETNKMFTGDICI